MCARYPNGGGFEFACALAHDLRSLGVLGPLRDRLAQVRLEVRQLTRQEACESAKLLDCGDGAKRSRRFGCLPWSLARALSPKRWLR
jgi:hypothetical protein